MSEAFGTDNAGGDGNDLPGVYMHDRETVYAFVRDARTLNQRGALIRVVPRSSEPARSVEAVSEVTVQYDENDQMVQVFAFYYEEDVDQSLAELKWNAERFRILRDVIKSEVCSAAADWRYCKNVLAGEVRPLVSDGPEDDAREATRGLVRLKARLRGLRIIARYADCEDEIPEECLSDGY